MQETINDYVDGEWAPLLQAFFSQKGALAVYTLHDALVRAEASDNPFNFKSPAEEKITLWSFMRRLAIREPIL